jgi:hypothetical protein
MVTYHGRLCNRAVPVAPGCCINKRGFRKDRCAGRLAFCILGAAWWIAYVILARQKTRAVNRAPKDQNRSKIKVVSPLEIPSSNYFNGLDCQTRLMALIDAIRLSPRTVKPAASLYPGARALGTPRTGQWQGPHARRWPTLHHDRAVHPLFRGRSHPMDAVAAAVVDQRVIRAPSNRGGGPIQV